MIYLVYEADYEGANIYGLFEDKLEAFSVAQMRNEDEYQLYLQGGSPMQYEVERRESDLKMVKAKKKSARSLHELEHAKNQLTHAQQLLEREQWTPLPRSSFRGVQVKELPVNEELDEYLI